MLTFPRAQWSYLTCYYCKQVLLFQRHTFPSPVAGTISVFWLQVCSTNIKFILSRCVALCSNLIFIYWCIVYWCFAFSCDEILEAKADKEYHYLHKFLTEIWVKSSFSAILFPRISSVQPLWRAWQAVRKADLPFTLWASGFQRKFAFFPQGFCSCVLHVCVYAEGKGAFLWLFLYQKALLLTVDNSLQSG